MCIYTNWDTKQRNNSRSKSCAPIRANFEHIFNYKTHVGIYRAIKHEIQGVEEEIMWIPLTSFTTDLFIREVHFITIKNIPKIF